MKWVKIAATVEPEPEVRVTFPQSDMDVSVWRGDAAAGTYETFQVPAEENQTILDVVSWIQQNADPTLTYRFACRVGM